MDEFIEDVDWSIEPDGSLLLSDDDGPIIHVVMSQRATPVAGDSFDLSVHG
jgi:hypothetical protein